VGEVLDSLAPLAGVERHFEHAKPTVSKIGGVHSEVTSLSQQQDRNGRTHGDGLNAVFAWMAVEGKSWSTMDFLNRWRDETALVPRNVR
jgi:hypothetical protein